MDDLNKPNGGYLYLLVMIAVSLLITLSAGKRKYLWGGNIPLKLPDNCFNSY
jgi:hypothetical protein